jgi:hypothetical protein
MLMNVEKSNFKVSIFTHILEGYKVADKMKEHGVGALHSLIGGPIKK